jgi:hypothetical protein
MQIIFSELSPMQPKTNTPQKKRQPKRALEWRVRETMAARGIKTVTALVELLQKFEYEISISQLGRMIDGKSKNFNSETVIWLMEVLKCDLDGIVVSRRQRAARKRTENTRKLRVS